ncbi:alpha/beta fold hydrolase [Phenylobacterium sp.]|uniref:alpha/beta fold hydrolase n=1 Tax=Phenylobacterium sp. TaxID=1871053 RepID=UPI003D2DF11E
MEERPFETPFGPIVLVGEPAAFEGTRPLLVTIAGAFAIARGPLFHLAPHIGDCDVVSGHLPGNHCPTLISASVGVYASAYSHVISNAFAGRTVIGCGASIGGLVALGLRAPQVRNLLVIEPPLVMSKVWPMWPTLRHKLAADPDDKAQRDFIVNVFGVTEAAVAERRYDGLLEALRKPAHVLVGDRPLFPQSAFEKLPSLVDEPERAQMAAHAMIRLSVAPGAGHNVLQESQAAFLAALRQAIAG